MIEVVASSLSLSTVEKQPREGDGGCDVHGPFNDRRSRSPIVRFGDELKYEILEFQHGPSHERSREERKRRAEKEGTVQ